MFFPLPYLAPGKDVEQWCSSCFLDPNQQAVAYLMYEGQETRMPRAYAQGYTATMKL